VGQEPGRTNQKARTHAAIVEAAQALRSLGRSPTVAEAAHKAKVSRATAYRYFPTQEALQVELESKAVWLHLEAELDFMTSRDLETRLIALIDLVGATVAGNEASVRTALRVYQDTWLRRSPDSEVPAVRRGRRKEWIDTVLEPLQPMAADKLQRLRAVLALAVGPDPVVMLSDVVGLSPLEATSLLRWAGVALLRAGLADAGLAVLPTPKPDA
jgi:AcrR family transcriptional regulator